MSVEFQATPSEALTGRSEQKAIFHRSERICARCHTREGGTTDLASLSLGPESARFFPTRGNVPKVDPKEATTDAP